ncbi:hypothetical protein MKX03_021743 [Papaver bracteatum]|nr:hypothetical protein MKX03_021743 [Papaver bracteatum]
MELLKPSPANSSPITPLGFLERSATVYGVSTSIIYNNKTYTWNQTNRRCLQLASALKSIMGIQRGDVISVLSPNLPAMYELHFAVPMSGAILNNINTRLDARTISVILLILEAFSLFPSEIKPPMLILITNDDETENLSSSVDPDLTYEGLLKKGDPDFNWVRPESEWDPMVLNYTSGTISAPKGVVHSHRGLFIMTVDSLIDWSVPKQPVFLWTLEMFHANGWCYPWGMAAVGDTNICLRKFDDAKSVYSLIRQHNVTHMCGAPVVLNMLANEPGKEPLPNPVQILTAGAPPPAPVLFRTESLGFVVSHGYGLTETAGLVVSCAWKSKWNKLPTTERARLKARRVRTIGMAEIDVLDPESGLRVKQDGLSLGEIVLRGGSILLGYFKDPIGTSKCLREDGWFYTGDVGVMHPDGYLEIKDRSKDVIISGGENLSSVEVESILYSHPGAELVYSKAAVVARPDEFWGETPCAFVSLKPESNRPSQKDIMEFCRAKMPHYMVPKTFVFEESLPKTATGKIQKFVLRDKAKAMGSARVASRI